MLQAKVVVYGMVQGVGFRHSLWRTARAKKLNGWVRNRPDGSVEALLQGNRDAILDVVDWCGSGPVFARVRKVDVSWEEGGKIFHSFDIVF